MDADRLRVARKLLPLRALGLGKAPRVEEHAAQRLARLCVVRSQFERATERRRRLVDVAARGERAAQRVQELRRTSVPRERGSIVVDGFVDTAGALSERRGELGARGVELGRQLERTEQCGARAVRVTARERDAPEGELCDRGIHAILERAARRVLGPSEIAGREPFERLLAGDARALPAVRAARPVEGAPEQSS